MNQDTFKLGTDLYDHVVGLDDEPRDSNGFIILKPSARRVDNRKTELTTDISELEARLKKFKEEREQITKYQKSDDYKESKKNSKKKNKKKKMALLEMVFNNADHESDEEDDIPEEEEGLYRDSKKKRPAKKASTTLDTTYGKRFSPVVAMLHDTITEFDAIAAEIEEELKNSRNSSKSMYRSSQIGNLISAKSSKLSAVKELAAVATTVSNLEYKKDKDRQASEGSDTNKAIMALGAKYLRGGLDTFEDKKSKKDKKKSKDLYGGGRYSTAVSDDDDDSDEDDSSIRKMKEDSQRELANEFAKTLMNHRDDIKLTPHERYIAMEGKYTIIVAADALNPDNDWKFIAIDPKNGKEIKGFKDDYPGLLPKKKSCRMTFDLSRLKAYDKNSGRNYKLVLKT